MNISQSQRQVLKVLKPGGCIRLMPRKSKKYRLMDKDINPVRHIHGRTFKALLNKELITKQSDGSYAAVTKK